MVVKPRTFGGIRMKTLLIELRDLLAFQVKQAKQHDLCQITITVPRAVSLIHHLNEQIRNMKGSK